MGQANIKKKLIGLFAVHSMSEIEANESLLLKKELGVETYDKFLEYPANFPPYYNDWQKTIEGHLNIPDLSALNKNEIRTKICEIADEIVKTKKKVLEDYTC